MTESPLTWPVDFRYQLRIDDNWMDITDDVYTRDPVIITRGRPNEASDISPMRLNLTLKNHKFRYSPQNPQSDLFGKIGRNTIIRVGYIVTLPPDPGFDMFITRFIGEINKWPQRANVAGTDHFVPIEAAGITSRLDQGTRIVSCLRRRMAFEEAPTLVGYWPMEDEEGASQFASFSDSPPAKFSGDVELEQFDGIDASLPIPLVNDGRIVAQVATHPESIASEITMAVRLPSDQITSTPFIALTAYTSGEVARAEIQMLETGGGGFGARLHVFDDDGAEISFATLNGFGEDLFGRTAIIQLIFETNISDNLVLVRLTMIDDPPLTSIGFSSVNTGDREFGRVQSLIVNQGRDDTHGLAVGHLAIWHEEFRFDFVEAARGFRGESAVERINRILNEDDIGGSTTGVNLVERMGAQRPATTMQILRECADVDGGNLIDNSALAPLAIAYTTRTNLANLTPRRVLDWSEGHIMPPFQPVEDDQRVRNDVEISRPAGSAARHEQLEGRLSVQDPPDGVGRYDERRELNAASDDQVKPLAEWRVHRGTIDEQRIPELTVSLRKHPQIAFNPHDVYDQDPPGVGRRIQIVNTPVWISAETMDLIIEGYKETITADDWRITYQTSPYEPFVMGVLDSAELGRLGAQGITVGSVFQAGIDTTLTVSGQFITGDLIPAFTTDPADFPFDIRVAGVVLRVTGASAVSLNTQDLTVGREPVNGIRKEISAGSDVQLRRSLKLAPGFRD